MVQPGSVHSVTSIEHFIAHECCMPVCVHAHTCRLCWMTSLFLYQPDKSLLCVACLEQVRPSTPSHPHTLTPPHSHTGKSTVAALLERFYEPTDGVILLDGVPLSTLDPSWLRRDVIGYISQEPVLFAATIAENIRYGRPGASEEEVVAAAKLANAHEFIEGFPDGYSTVLGERGVTLSGGQKQRWGSLSVGVYISLGVCVCVWGGGWPLLTGQRR